MFPNDPIRQAILERRPSYEIREIVTRETEFLSMKEIGVVQTLRGQTTFEEVLHQVPRLSTPRPIDKLFELSGYPDPLAGGSA